MSETQQREVMNYDVAIVGAGPAGLAAAIHLKRRQPEYTVCVIEKGAEIGSHILSGAVIEPEPLDELVPGWRESPPPVLTAVREDRFYLFGRRRAWRLPVPPQAHNRGNYIVSLGALCAWLAPRAEALGVDLFPGFAAAKIHHRDDGGVGGVVIGDMGVGRDGRPRDTHMPGVVIAAKVTVLAEGCRGHLTKRLVEKYDLARRAAPQAYGIGLKELWQLPAGRGKPGRVEHSIGWPLDRGIYGGSFLYHLDGDRVAVGFVAGLDYQDPAFEPYEAFQQFKHHPRIHALLAGGEIVSAGARALVEGGYQSLPCTEMPGALLIGDAAGLLNVPKIKGTHQALRSGMLAALHLAERLDSSGFDTRLRASPIVAELKKVRNIRPGFYRGLWAGMLNGLWETATAGHSPWTLKIHADHEALRKLPAAGLAVSPRPPRDLPPRDRLAGVYFAATQHDEDQPVHLRILDPEICTTRCTTEYGNPCTRFCPAAVYEMIDDAAGRRLQINAANCVHCKTCDIKDPYQIIDWVTPEGGSGPQYRNL